MLAKLWQLFYTFFLTGLFTIGGGYAMIPMIQDQVVGRGWLEEAELMNFFAIAESTPGPFAVNTATLVGFTQLTGSPIFGAIMTTIAVILPSFIIILFIAKYFNNFMEKKAFKWALYGIKAVVVGLILSVVWSLVKEEFSFNFSSREDVLSDIYVILIAIIILALSKRFKKMGTIPLIIISGFLGFIFFGIL